MLKKKLSFWGELWTLISTQLSETTLPKVNQLVSNPDKGWKKSRGAQSRCKEPPYPILTLRIWWYISPKIFVLCMRSLWIPLFSPLQSIQNARVQDQLGLACEVISYQWRNKITTLKSLLKDVAHFKQFFLQLRF